jgi:hypothetical protein
MMICFRCFPKMAHLRFQATIPRAAIAKGNRGASFGFFRLRYASANLGHPARLCGTGAGHKWLSPDFMIVRSSESQFWELQVGKISVRWSQPEKGILSGSHGTLD